MVALSATIITFNEEENIARCLESLAGVADEVVVVDSFSTDNTAAICAESGARIVRHAFEGHIQQKNIAVGLARHDRVLSLDADEALSEELKASVEAAKKHWSADAYAVNRLTNYCGRWIRHGGWYPDRKTRLWDRNKGRWGGVNPHDRVVLDGDAATGRLKGDLLHFSYTTVRQHLQRMNSFSDIAAAEARKAGRRSFLVGDLVLNPVFTFLKKYFFQLGLLDGEAGFSIAVNSAYGRYLKYAKLRELERRET